MSGLTVGILAAGQGVRMKSVVPKVLHILLGRTILSHVVGAAKGLTPDRIVIVKAPQDLNVTLEDVSFTVQDEPRGTGDALRCLLGDATIQGTLLVIPGDVPLLRPETLSSFLNDHRASNAALTVLTFRPTDPDRYGRIVRNEDGALSAIVEASDATPKQLAIDEVNAGIYCLESSECRPLVESLTSDNAQGEFYATDLVSALGEHGRTVSGWTGPDPDEFLGVNTRADLAEAHRILGDRIKDSLMDAGVTLVDPRSTHVECDVSVGADTVLFPFTVLRTGVRVGRDCRVGPFAHLLDGTVLADGAAVQNFTGGNHD